MEQLFRNLFYPAAAGNVGWSFFYLAIRDGVNARSMPLLVVLLLLFIYLTIEWTQTLTRKAAARFWLADGVLLISIVVFAIATQEGVGWLDASLALVLVIASAGNLFLLWRRPTDRPGESRLRAVSNAIGLVPLFVLPRLAPSMQRWSLMAAVLTAIVLYWVMSKHDQDGKTVV